jgi:hypothetical protein
MEGYLRAKRREESRRRGNKMDRRERRERKKERKKERKSKSSTHLIKGLFIIGRLSVFCKADLIRVEHARDCLNLLHLVLLDLRCGVK